LEFLVIVKDEWLPENGILTPTQKIKRPTIKGEYEKHNNHWYSENKKVIWFGW
jgi:long-chain acyl-CoA synthetase